MELDQLNIHMEENEVFRQSINIHMETVKVMLLFSHWVMSNFFCNPMGYSMPGSSIHGISQARTQEWVAISFSRGYSWPSDQTQVSYIGRQILYHWTSWEAQN